MKKGIKFRDSSVLNLILFFFNPLNILKYRDKMKEAKRVLTLFQYGRHGRYLWTDIPCTLCVVVIKCYSFFFFCDLNFLYG